MREVKKVCFFPTAAAGGPHFGHLVCYLANWALAKKTGSELMILVLRHWEHSAHEASRFTSDLLLPNLIPDEIKFLDGMPQDELLYSTIEKAIENPSVIHKIIKCQEKADYCLELHRDGKLLSIRPLTSRDPEMTELRQFRAGEAASLIIGRIFGITHMIRGADVAESVAHFLPMYDAILPGVTLPSPETISIPLVRDHAGVKLSSGLFNGVEYSIRNLCETMGPEATLMAAFSVLRPDIVRWDEKKFSQQILVDLFDLKKLPAPDKFIQTRNYEWREGEVWDNPGIFQRLNFDVD